MRQSARWFFLAVLATALGMGACKKNKVPDLTQLDQVGVGFNGIEQLRQLNVTKDEVQQLMLARQAGLSDPACIELVRISHLHKEPFGGQAAAGLLSAGFREASILQLARLDQLGAWSGEAQAMRLAGLSDTVVLALAARRAAGEATLSGRKVADLQNAGLTQIEIIAQINRGATDADADEIVMRRNYAAGGHSFVSERGLRRR